MNPIPHPHSGHDTSAPRIDPRPVCGFSFETGAPRRFAIVSRLTTTEERSEMKRKRVAEAIRWQPPLEIHEYKEVFPDDPSFAEAPVEEYTSAWPDGIRLCSK